MAEQSIVRSARGYGVGWITALPLERVSAEVMLDAEHDEPGDFEQHESDKNSYTWGQIGKHKVVIASLPPIYGTVSATRTALGMRASFPNLKFALLVGIAAGTPSSKNDIRLGDIVVSQPWGTNTGVVQYDLGKARQGDGWDLKGVIAPPVDALLYALTNLQAKHLRQEPQMGKFLREAAEKHPIWASSVTRPEPQEDRLFRSQYVHQDGTRDCAKCDTGKIQTRPARTSRRPQIFYGTIASGNTLVKDALLRNDIRNVVGSNCCCIEMEAAGVMDSLPCIVVRGICDYADTHKNDQWQGYAAAVAAAYAKELLGYARLSDVASSRSTMEPLHEVRSELIKLQTSLQRTGISRHGSKASQFLRALNICPYADRKNRINKRIGGTCEWFKQHPAFRTWASPGRANLLWVTADPGCGKSVLMRYLVDEVFDDLYDASELCLCHFFFSNDFADQNRVSYALCSLLRQLLIQAPSAITEDLLKTYARTGTSFLTSFESLWKALLAASNTVHERTVICVLDALDECKVEDCRTLITAMCALYKDARLPAKVKFLVTSREYNYIHDALEPILSGVSRIDFATGNEDGTNIIDSEVDIVINYRITALSRHRQLTENEQSLLLKRFTSVEHRTYLWAHLTLSLFEESLSLTEDKILEMFRDLPTTVEQAYEKILCTRTREKQARLLLSIIIAALRPITLRELSIAYEINEDDADWSQLSCRLEPESRFQTMIRNTCGLFVIVANARVYLLHSTARQFLLRPASGLFGPNHAYLPDKIWIWQASLQLSECHALLAERCLWYLNMEYATSTSWTAYSMNNWYKHFRDSWLDYRAKATKTAIDWCRSWSDTSTLEKAAMFGLVSVVQRLFDPKFRRKYDRQECSQALWIAARDGHTSIVKFLVEQGAEPDTNEKGALDSTGEDRALHLAVRLSNEGVVRILLSCKADVNILGIQGQSPLHVAARHFQPEIINILLMHDAKRNATDRIGRIPWDIFYKFHRERGPCSSIAVAEDAFRLLGLRKSLNRICGPRGEPLIHEAAEVPCFFCVKVLLRGGASIRSKDSFSRTLLHIAADTDSVQLIELTQQYGLTTYDPDASGLTPLERAIQRGAVSAAETMLRDDARFTAHSSKGHGILGWTIKELRKASHGHLTEMIKLLIKVGVDVNMLWMGALPLIEAVRTGNVEAAEILLKAGARFGQVGSLPAWWNGLQQIIGEQDYDMWEIFLRHGYDANSIDVTGFNLLHQACKMANYKLAELLVRYGANVNGLTTDGQAPIHIVIYSHSNLGNRATITLDFLLQHGANPRLLDSRGCSALERCEHSLALLRDVPSFENGANVIQKYNEFVRLLQRALRAHKYLGAD